MKTRHVNKNTLLILSQYRSFCQSLFSVAKQKKTDIMKKNGIPPK